MADATTYTLTALGPLGSVPASNYSVAFGINDAGQVVGKGTSSDGIQHAIVSRAKLPFTVRASFFASRVFGRLAGISQAGLVELIGLRLPLHG